MSAAARRPLAQVEFVGLMASCMAMAALSIDIMLPAFGRIRDDFDLGAGSTKTSWIVTAFFLGLAVGQLVYGPLSDRFGRKPLLYVGLAVMAVAAATSALAPSLGVLIACRVVWGMGAAAPRSLTLAMVRDTYGGELMARTMSLIMATFILVPVLAPGLGAAILTFAPWRVVLGVPAVAALGVMLWLRRLPETLPIDRRRSTSPAALLEAAGEVVRTPQTIGLALALICLFGIMTSYVGSSEIIFDEVFDQSGLFPVIFGALALCMAAGSIINARIVTGLGLPHVLRLAAGYLVAIAAAMAIVAVATDGRPPLALFALLMALLLPVMAVLMPNANTAAMLPLPHVAGTAAAILGTVTTGGGALLGSVLDARFDGTILPFAQGVLLYGLLAAAGIVVLGLRPTPRTVLANRPDPAAREGQEAPLGQSVR